MSTLHCDSLGGHRGDAQKQLRKVLLYVAEKLADWALAVEAYGLEEIRKVPGYHDEPLKGKRAGQRSIRLSRAYRGIYVISGGALEFVSVEEVHKHDYCGGITMVAKKKALKADVAKSRPKGSVKASAFLEKLVGKPSFGRLLRSIREGEDASLAAFAKQLGIARTNLSDIELGRRGVSVERAAAWARLLGYHEGQFVKLALQAQLDEAGIKLRVDVHAA